MGSLMAFVLIILFYFSEILSFELIVWPVWQSIEVRERKGLAPQGSKLGGIQRG